MILNCKDTEKRLTNKRQKEERQKEEIQSKRAGDRVLDYSLHTDYKQGSDGLEANFVRQESKFTCIVQRVA